jgi:dynein heavy chain
LVAIPGAQTLYYYYVDIQERVLRKWADIVPDYTYTKEVPFYQMIVPTVDTLRYTYLLERLVAVNKPVLFTGGTGVGKSIIINDLLRKSEKNNFIPVNVNFTAQTSSGRTEEIVESKLDKKRKTLLGAPVGKKVLMFVDDVNMPQPDEFGAQHAIELLRQYLDFGGFYDRRKLFWKTVQDVTVVAACAPPGGGRNHMTPRFMRHFNIINLPPPNEESLRRIFSAIIKGFFDSGGYSEDIQNLGKRMVGASVELYSRICKELLPTPSKSHYTFNLRDLSKVFQGILQIRRSSVTSPTVMIRLWIHESLRVFHDRLVNDEDRLYFTQLITELLRRHFDLNWSHKSIFEGPPLMFGDFVRLGGTLSLDPIYDELTDMDKLTNMLDTFLESYNLNSSFKEMKLIFFRDAIEHISRISRIIRQPRGNALLVGVGGCGKRSLTRLACHMADYTCYQIELSKHYGVQEFREDLKKLYNMAGVANQPVVFLLSDTQIAKETFLEDINNILNSGEVPNLHEPDEIEKIVNLIRPAAKAAGIPEQRDQMYNYFIRVVQENLHIVLCMSPIGDDFRRRCRMFPSLVNCCTIDWFDEWPKDALLAVSTQFLGGVDLGSVEMRHKISEMCVHIHSGVSTTAARMSAEIKRRYYTTPTSYLELINLFISMLDKKRGEYESVRDKLSKGLEQLKKTNEVVSEMQKKLEQLQPELERKAADTEKLLIHIKKDQATVDVEKKACMEEEAEVKKQTNEIEILAAEAKRDLDEALPALEIAVRALNALNKNGILLKFNFRCGDQL